MKFYYVALTIDSERPVQIFGGTRRAYYIKKHQAIEQRDFLNTIYSSFNYHKKDQEPYKVYCVESEPKEIE